MDGLSIRQGQSLLNTGKTASELRAGEMNMPRVSTGSTGATSPTAGPQANGQIEGASFKDVLRDAITETNALQKNADVQAQNLATGKTTNIPEVMMAVEKADIALRLMTQVRNKIIDAYSEIMKMQV